MNDWQVEAAARLAFVVGECLPDVVPSKGQLVPRAGSRTRCTTAAPPTKTGRREAIRGGLPNWHHRAKKTGPQPFALCRIQLSCGNDGRL